MNANGGLSPEGWGYVVILFLTVGIVQVLLLISDMLPDRVWLDLTKIFKKKESK